MLAFRATGRVLHGESAAALESPIGLRPAATCRQAGDPTSIECASSVDHIRVFREGRAEATRLQGYFVLPSREQVLAYLE
jgi:hypothetical protein